MRNEELRLEVLEQVYARMEELEEAGDYYSQEYEDLADSLYELEQPGCDMDCWC